MEFRILGSVEVADGGLVRDLGGLRERTLLARLLLAAGQVVSADRLAEDLWAGRPPEHYMATLRVYISRLRRALGDGSAVVITQPPGYRVTLGRSELDADRFARLVAAAREDLAARRPEVAAAGLREALGLWRGPALSDVADFAFAQADAARLEEARMAAVEDRVEADLACGRHASLVSELDGLVAGHPLRERLCGQRMLAPVRAPGRRPAGLSGPARKAGPRARHRPDPGAAAAAAGDPAPGAGARLACGGGPARPGASREKGERGGNTGHGRPAGRARRGTPAG